MPAKDPTDTPAPSGRGYPWSANDSFGKPWGLPAAANPRESSIETALQPDSDILKAIHAVLDDDFSLGGAAIDIRVEAGQVSMSGHVDTPDTKQRIENHLRRVPGVRRVRNNLVIPL